MNRFILMLCTGIILIQSCRGKMEEQESSFTRNLSTDYIQFKVGDTSYQFVYFPADQSTSTNYYDTTIHSVNIGMWVPDTNQSAFLALDKVYLDKYKLPYTFNAGIDTTEVPGFFWFTEYSTQFSSDGIEGVDTFPYFTLTLTSKNLDVLEGYFSGNIREVTSQKTLTVKEGKFRVKIKR